MKFWFGRQWRWFRNATHSPSMLYVLVQNPFLIIRDNTCQELVIFEPGKQRNRSRRTPPIELYSANVEPKWSNILVKSSDSNRLLTVVLCTWKVSTNSSTIWFVMFRMDWSISSSENTDGRPDCAWPCPWIFDTTDNMCYRQLHLHHRLDECCGRLPPLSNSKSKHCLMYSLLVSIVLIRSNCANLFFHTHSL